MNQSILLSGPAPIITAHPEMQRIRDKGESKCEDQQESIPSFWPDTMRAASNTERAGGTVEAPPISCLRMGEGNFTEIMQQNILLLL